MGGMNPKQFTHVTNMTDKSTAIALEPDGGNLYLPHPLMVHSGRFWRCSHGITGFAGDLQWLGCSGCADANPEAYRRFHEIGNPK